MLEGCEMTEVIDLMGCWLIVISLIIVGMSCIIALTAPPPWKITKYTAIKWYEEWVEAKRND